MLETRPTITTGQELERMSLLTATLFTFGLAGALVDAPATTAAPPAASAKANEGPAKRLCEKLSCTAAQKTEVQSITKELVTDTQPDRESIRRLQRKLADEIAKAKPSEPAIDALAGELAKHQSEMTKRGLDAVLELHAVLDAGQRKLLADIVAEHGVRALVGRRMDGKAGKRGRGPKGAGKAK